MDDSKVLSLNDVSVRYRKHDSQTTAALVKGLFSGKKREKGFFALRHISFELEKGDMLGVIGRNGAGKSTMMKTISGTLSPAAGTVEHRGKMCALLELATGFDQDMTVRENVYLRGALLGYSKEFIDEKYDEIIDFAEMREFQNNPFRTLSSGMKSRIAFAIASMVEPDIIILDEVFAVGDGDFRKKSQERMEKIISSGSCTGIIVSHSLANVRQQCNKVLWLNKGKMVMFGDPSTVCDAYKHFLDTKELPRTESVIKAETAPIEIPSASKSAKLKSWLIGLLMLLFAAVGCFVWSQFDMVKAYLVAHYGESIEILRTADDYHSQIFETMGIDNTGWQTMIIDGNIKSLNEGRRTPLEVARLLLENAGVPEDAADYELQLAAAEIEIVKRSYMFLLDNLCAEVRSEFQNEPIGKYRSLIVYAYFNSERFYSLEDKCDSAIDEILEDIRSYCRENGIPESLADRVENIYAQEKQELLAYYCIKLR